MSKTLTEWKMFLHRYLCHHLLLFFSFLRGAHWQTFIFPREQEEISFSCVWYFPIKSENEYFENRRWLSSTVEGFSHRAWPFFFFFMGLTWTRRGTNWYFSQSHNRSDLLSNSIICLFYQNEQQPTVSYI